MVKIEDIQKELNTRIEAALGSVSISTKEVEIKGPLSENDYRLSLREAANQNERAKSVARLVEKEKPFNFAAFRRFAHS